MLATQNPIEQEGTYPLPEAQVDRFMLKLTVDYPTREEERQILDRMATTGNHRASTPVVTTRRHPRRARLVDQIYVDDKIKDYIVDLVFATREPAGASGSTSAPLIQYGASPRATLCLTLAAQGARVPPRPRLRHAAGREGDRRPTCCATASSSPTRPRPRRSTSDEIVQRVLDGVPVP